MDKINIELQKDYQYLEELVYKEPITDEEIFKIIGKYDMKYRNNSFHIEYFEGLLSNIGSELKSISILNYTIDRLLKKDNIKELDKYYYDIGTTILSKADIGFEENHSIEYLLSNKSYNEARKYFSLILVNDMNHFLRGKINLTNILNKFGRNYEALFYYDEILKYDSSFGIALANKAYAIEYYIRLSPYKSFALYSEISKLLSLALQDDRIDDIGGPYCREYFINFKSGIDSFLQKNKFKGYKKIIPKKLSNYQKFILINNLYLNYDFGYFYDEKSIEDSLFPNLIEHIDDKRNQRIDFMSEKTYYTFNFFNQIVEDFTTARKRFYNSVHSNETKYDSSIKFIYLYDYTKHSPAYGDLKQTFSTLYNCLDKIAHLIRYYFSNIEISDNENIYFEWLTKKEFKEIVLEKNNYQLLALYSLAIDFQDGFTYSKIKAIRNRITHSYLNLNEMVIREDKYSNSEMFIEDFIMEIKKLFMIVKSALLYSIYAINNSNDIEKDMIFQMNATFEGEIFDI